ncbi:hypothetical protein B0H34DRAFT_847470 [Crassisporium funariophilum]|nr:hypothetical protein B0H34DRAFT_847470 [Crassisporium funariophilum]
MTMELCAGDSSHTASIGAAPAILVENPFTSLFGPATGPSGWLELLGEIAAKSVQKDAKGPMSRDISTAGKAPTASKSTACSKTFGPGMKKVTNSSSAKNLYYIKFLQTNNPITPAAFETHWNGLDKDTIKFYLIKLVLAAEIHATKQISEVDALDNTILACRFLTAPATQLYKTNTATRKNKTITILDPNPAAYALFMLFLQVPAESAQKMWFSGLQHAMPRLGPR